MSDWKHVGTCVEGERFVINSLNVWDHKWIPVRRRLGNFSAPPVTGLSLDENLRVIVKDPVYGQEHTFNVYEIAEGARTAEFAAGEFSNLVYGFYVRQAS